MLRDTTYRDMRVSLFGEEYENPLLIAPVGVQTIFSEDRETGVAQVAAELGVPYIMSTAASASVEEVAKASGDGKRWFQLYWPQDDEITISVCTWHFEACAVLCDGFFASRMWWEGCGQS